MSTRADVPDPPGEPLLFVVIVTGMFVAAGPAALQLVWLAGVGAGALLWRQHVTRTAAHNRER